MTNEHRSWRTLGRAVLFIFCCAVILAAVAPFAPKDSKFASGLFIGSVTTALALAITFAFVSWDGCGLGDVGAAPSRRSPQRFSFGLLIGLLLVALNTGAMWSAGHVQWARGTGSANDGMIALVVFITLSAREELAFHGYPLRRLTPAFGVWSALLIIALFFAAEHVAGGATNGT